MFDVFGHNDITVHDTKKHVAIRVHIGQCDSGERCGQCLDLGQCKKLTK